MMDWPLPYFSHLLSLPLTFSPPLLYLCIGKGTCSGFAIRMRPEFATWIGQEIHQVSYSSVSISCFLFQMLANTTLHPSCTYHSRGKGPFRHFWIRRMIFILVFCHITVSSHCSWLKY